MKIHVPNTSHGDNANARTSRSDILYGGPNLHVLPAVSKPLGECGCRFRAWQYVRAQQVTAEVEFTKLHVNFICWTTGLVARCVRGFGYILQKPDHCGVRDLLGYDDGILCHSFRNV